MRAKNYRKTLFCGTLSLIIMGGISPVFAADYSGVAVTQQSETVTGVVSDAAGPITAK